MNGLPLKFEERMKQMLGEEYDAFLRSYEDTRRPGLRVNTLREKAKTLESSSLFDMQPIPWAPHGYYYDPLKRPGKHPLHEAGAYYIQEPSAMAVAALSGVRPGMRVLDLCAAPGGKSTQLASMLEGEGILYSNEIHPARAKILSQNIERMGISNAVVLNEDPKKLAERFPLYFDTVVVDAPCSGEGMFRKEEEAIPNWSPENVELCARRQSGILDCAALHIRAAGERTERCEVCHAASRIPDPGSSVVFRRRIYEAHRAFSRQARICFRRRDPGTDRGFSERNDPPVAS